MDSKKKSNFVVLTAITLHGVQRTKGYRWVKAGKIRRAE
jgi:hypothetical protein